MEKCVPQLKRRTRRIIGVAAIIATATVLMITSIIISTAKYTTPSYNEASYNRYGFAEYDISTYGTHWTTFDANFSVLSLSDRKYGIEFFVNNTFLQQPLLWYIDFVEDWLPCDMLIPENSEQGDSIFYISGLPPIPDKPPNFPPLSDIRFNGWHTLNRKGSYDWKGLLTRDTIGFYGEDWYLPDGIAGFGYKITKSTSWDQISGCLVSSELHVLNYSEGIEGSDIGSWFVRINPDSQTFWSYSEIPAKTDNQLVLSAVVQDNLLFWAGAGMGTVVTWVIKKK